MSNDSFAEVCQESLRQRANAWDAVASALSEVYPGWWDGPLNGMDSAVAAIRRLRPEVTDEMVQRAQDAYDAERYGEEMAEAPAMRVALTAALEGSQK